MRNHLGIYTVFRGTGSSETYWVVVLLVAPFPSVGHGQAHVSSHVAIWEKRRTNKTMHNTENHKTGLFYFP